MYNTEFNLVRDFNNKDAMNECEYNINELYSFQSNDLSHSNIIRKKLKV